MARNKANATLNINTGFSSDRWLKVVFYVLFNLLLIQPVFAAKHDDEPVGDEIVVSLEVKNVGIADIPAIYDGREVYLSVTSVFDVLKVRNMPAPSFDTVKGFFLSEQDSFLVDHTHDQIKYKGKTFELGKGGLIHTDNNLYLNLKYFNSIFSLGGTFYFRRLVVTMVPEIELPVVREMRQEVMRRNLKGLIGEQKADTNVKRQHPFFHLGMADWAVMSSQQSTGPDQTTLNLGLGGVLAGGEANASINYYSNQDFNEKLQYYQWRYVNNDNPVVRQVVAGKIFTQATSSLYAPVVGAAITNAPTIYRKAYGTYTLSNNTEPNWVVELYVNDVLVDYKKADASGFYTFDVPLIYGYTVVKLKFYGPYGEERTSQQYINIPFNFLPVHEVEYSVNGGVVEDGKDSKFSRSSASYGLSRNLTVGGGLEYLSSVTSGASMPFFNTSLRLSSRAMFSGEYTYGVRSRGVLTYRMPSNLQVDLDYTKYDKGQTAIYFNYLEERKATISMPIHAKGYSLFTRLTLDQIVVPTTQYTNMEWAITGFVKRVGLNLSTYASFVKADIPYIYSIFSVTLPLPAKVLMTSQLQYDYKGGSPVFLKFNFERHLIGNGYFSLAYQEYFNVNTRNVLLGLRYDFSFSRVALSVLAGNNNTYSRVEAASGSFIYDHGSHYLNASNRTNVGKGAILLQPFLDLNCNGIQDEGEPKAPGLKIRVNGGRIVYDEKDSSIRILDLEPYYKYYIDLNRNSFDNISWQIKNHTMNVEASPNNFTRIKIPVQVVGEASGTVSLKGKDAKKAKGQGQIIVDICDETGIVAHAITESDGFFSYIGLPPGDYTARVDTTQLRKLHFSATPASAPVHIKPSRDGDVVDGLEFVLQYTGKDTTTENKGIAIENQPNIADTPAVKQPEKITGQQPGQQKQPEITQKQPVKNGEKVIGKPGADKEPVINGKFDYGILVDIFANIGRAGVVKARLVRTFKVAVNIDQTRDDFKVIVTGFTAREDAELFLRKLEKAGYKEPLIIRMDKEAK